MGFLGCIVCCDAFIEGEVTGSGGEVEVFGDAVFESDELRVFEESEENREDCECEHC